jgi:hypothetical protein
MTLTRSQLRSEIASLLADIRQRRQILIDQHTIWGELLNVDPEAAGYLACLLDIGDTRTCPVSAHASQYRYIGNGRYVCDYCARSFQEAL